MTDACSHYVDVLGPLYWACIRGFMQYLNIEIICNIDIDRFSTY